MDVLEKITVLQNERNWTSYQLSVESGIPQSTISSWYNKKTVPTVTSIESLCEAFKITVAQFFSEGEPVPLTVEQQHLINSFARLSKFQQEYLLKFLNSL